MHYSFSEFEHVTPDLWLANENEWKEKLLKLPCWDHIPLINSNASHNLADNSLVRFRGMIQDMQDCEFYFQKFEVYNTVTNEIIKKSGKYRDAAAIMENEKINYTENLQSAQRQSMVVVSIPGLNDWVQKVQDDSDHLKRLEDQPNTSKRLLSTNTKLKRSHDETQGYEMEVKEPRTEERLQNTANVVSREHLLNFPLPNVPSKSCIVKIYEEDTDLKLNVMIEVVGFLSFDPTLCGEFQNQNDTLSEEELSEAITHNPPPSLIPRLHAVYVKKLDHCNPLVKNVSDQDAVMRSANIAREHLLISLTGLLLGDRLAAEYFICYLIATIYRRMETFTLGQFCLNLSNVPVQEYPNYTKELYDIIEQFVTKSYYLPLTIDNMNTLKLLPKKDYNFNRLTSGILQLSSDTHLVLDETKMEEGRLDSAGLSNLTALKKLIQTQKVEYDFKYYTIEFDSNIPVLIFSEGKSLLPSDCHVPLRPEASTFHIFHETLEATRFYLKEEVMKLIRIYLTHLKLVKYTIREDLQFVQEDFVAMRSSSDNENPVTQDDLHRLLVLARLVSLSKGNDTLNKECWDMARSMETQRLNRFKTEYPGAGIFQ